MCFIIVFQAEKLQPELSDRHISAYLISVKISNSQHDLQVLKINKIITWLSFTIHAKHKETSLLQQASCNKSRLTFQDYFKKQGKDFFLNL